LNRLTNRNAKVIRNIRILETLTKFDNRIVFSFGNVTYLTETGRRGFDFAFHGTILLRFGISGHTIQQIDSEVADTIRIALGLECVVNRIGIGHEFRRNLGHVSQKRNRNGRDTYRITRRNVLSSARTALRVHPETCLVFHVVTTIRIFRERIGGETLDTFVAGHVSNTSESTNRTVLATQNRNLETFRDMRLGRFLLRIGRAGR